MCHHEQDYNINQKRYPYDTCLKSVETSEIPLNHTHHMMHTVLQSTYVK